MGLVKKNANKGGYAVTLLILLVYTYIFFCSGALYSETSLFNKPLILFQWFINTNYLILLFTLALLVGNLYFSVLIAQSGFLRLIKWLLNVIVTFVFIISSGLLLFSTENLYEIPLSGDVGHIRIICSDFYFVGDHKGDIYLLSRLYWPRATLWLSLGRSRRYSLWQSQWDLDCNFSRWCCTDSNEWSFWHWS